MRFFSYSKTGGVGLEGDEGGEESNLNFFFISVVWLVIIYKNLISIKI